MDPHRIFLKFILHTNNERSVTLNKLCKELPAMFAKHSRTSHIDPGIFAADTGNARANSAAITALLTFDKKDPFPLFPPFMYRDQQKDNKNLLLNPLGPVESSILHFSYIIFIFLQVLRFTLFANSKTITKSTRTVGAQWGIKKCSASSIAFALILVCWLFLASS